MKIMIWGVHPGSESGLGHVGAFLLDAISNLSHSVTFVANQDQSLGPSRGPNYIIYTLNDIKDNFYRQAKEFDLIITIGDLWMCKPIAKIVEAHAVPWIAYFGCEGNRYPGRVIQNGGKESLRLDRIIEYISCVWAYTTITKSALLRDFPDLDIEVLPHCVDVEQIKGTGKVNIKELLDMPKGNPFALFVGDNSRRKGIDIFCNWLYKNKNWVGYLHTPLFRSIGYDLYELRRQLDLEERLWFRKDLEDIIKMKTFPDKFVYGLYKSCDLFLHPHRAEGFGLCVLEALIAGAPVLASDCGGPKTFLPKQNKIPVYINNYISLDGIGYNACEPINIPSKIPKKREFDAGNYTVDKFKENVKRLLSREYKPKLWKRVI